MARASCLFSIFIATSLAFASQVVDAKREFIARIPNGGNVGRAHALGHITWDGGGPLNGFGEAFAAAGFKWTRSLCKGDADGDGQTNGEELGDPCCVWVAERGELPLITDVVSHPGDFARKLNGTDLGRRQQACRAVETMVGDVSSSASSSSSVGESSNLAGSSSLDSDWNLQSRHPHASPMPALESAASTVSRCGASPVRDTAVVALLIAIFA